MKIKIDPRGFSVDGNIFFLHTVNDLVLYQQICFSLGGEIFLVNNVLRLEKSPILHIYLDSFNGQKIFKMHKNQLVFVLDS